MGYILQSEDGEVTPGERAVIRTIIRALEGKGSHNMDSMMLSYGLPLHLSKPTKNRAAALLQALVDNDRA